MNGWAATGLVSTPTNLRRSPTATPLPDEQVVGILSVHATTGTVWHRFRHRALSAMTDHLT
jgi:hypothetical protein